MIAEPIGQIEQGEMNRFEWRQILPLLFVVLVSIALRAGIASIPLERDEGGYAYIAQRWLAGDIPYRDSFDQKPPGTVLVYAALFFLGGTSIEAIHWLGHAFLLGSLGFLYLIGRRQFSHTVGWLGALAGVVLVMDSSVLGNASNTEVFAILPLTAGMYLSLIAPQRASLAQSFCAGIMGGLALSFKQVTLPIVVFYGASIVVACWPLTDKASSPSAFPRSNPTWRLHLSCFVVGVGLVLALSCLYFVWQGAWQPFYECVVGYNLTYSGQIPRRAYVAIFLENVKPLVAVQWPLLIFVLPALADAITGRARSLRPFLAWWFFSFLALSVGGYYRNHYFIFLLLPTALLSAYGLMWVAQRLSSLRPPGQAGVAAGVTFLACAWPVFQHREYYLAESPEHACRALYGINPFPESLIVAERLRNLTGPDDTIFIFGSEPQILFYAQRRSASRYIYVYPLYLGSRDRVDRQTSVVQELRHNQPRFIVVVTRNVSTSFLVQPDSPTILETELDRMLQADYLPFAVVEVSRNWNHRWIEGVLGDDEKIQFAYAPDETPTLQIWERRDSRNTAAGD